jgi:hypothetical protein
MIKEAASEGGPVPDWDADGAGLPMGSSRLRRVTLSARFTDEDLATDEVAASPAAPVRPGGGCVSSRDATVVSGNGGARSVYLQRVEASRCILTFLRDCSMLFRGRVFKYIR